MIKCYTCLKRTARFPYTHPSQCGRCFTILILCPGCFAVQSRNADCPFCIMIKRSSDQCIGCPLNKMPREFPWVKPLWCSKCYSKGECVQCGDMCVEDFQIEQKGRRPTYVCVLCFESEISKALVSYLLEDIIGLITSWLTE